MEKRLALVIGNSDYQGVSKLKNPLNDANDMANCFEKLGFDVKKFLDTNCDELNGCIREFAMNLEDYEVVLFY